MARKPKNQSAFGRGKGLNSIHQGIHCPATTEGVGVDSEIDQIQINHFLETLARVALAVASRRLASEGDEVTCEP